MQVDGPYEMRKAVRKNLSHGVDQIKLMVTEDMTQGSQLMLDEIQAATEVAHQRGKRVCVHAWHTEGVKTAIQGGADCIEHGLLDDEAVEMMVENDVFYVPTIRCTHDVKLMRKSGTPEFWIEKASGASKTHIEGFLKAMKAGVKIACGGDFSPVAFFTHSEIEHLVRAGMGEMEALIAATRISADLCGVADQLGTVEVGKLADLIVLSANPLKNISNIKKLKLVMKGGNLVDITPQEGLKDFRELFPFSY
jgi:imidazolonepropionase-like amidohydrolase